ncbi:MAG: hypothetical protein FJ027_05100 [Candidatus Rokubacteria bacterium]|nr:hypothetical protein [Candidatus Rokubacteria bacterium]
MSDSDTTAQTDEAHVLHEAPAALVVQIAHHWETYRPRMSRALKTEGTFEESVQAAALLTSEATHSLMTEAGLNPDQARELMREEWAFLPAEDDDASGTSRNVE